MKNEYLITFNSKDEICTNVDKFKNLLSAHDSISFSKNDTISFKGQSFGYQLAQGNLPDDSLYYDLTLENTNSKNEDIYKNLLKEIRTICINISGRQIKILHDGIGEEYCNKGYPIIYKTENLMRKLIAKFMAISIGANWSDTSTPKEVMESVRSKGKVENINFLHEIDFIQLSNFLFKKYNKADAGRFLDSLKEKSDDDFVRVGDVKQYSTFTNWEKYFAENVKCDSEYLKSKWELLYEYRCKIAHCKGISKQDFEELSTISADICEKIQAALDSIGDVHVEEAEREELAENFSGTANENVADFISKYNKLTSLVQAACEQCSNDKDVYNIHITNKTNIKMQARYLSNTKEVISKETAELICSAQSFRNKIVHQTGIVEINESEMMKETSSIDTVINNISLLNPEELSKLKGVDYRNESLQEE